jgi:tetratricopeptide (TPR) repeat protein
MRGSTALDWAVFLGRANRGDPEAAFERALADLVRDVEASPRDVEGLMARGRAYYAWADWMRINHKPDPRVNLDAARADFEAVLKIAAGHVPARQAIADCLIIRATFAEKYDENPDPLLREAVKVYKALTRQNPKDVNAWHGLAGAWLWRARIEKGRKRSAAKERKEAIDAWARVLRLNPQDYEAQKETAKNWLDIGEELVERGKDGRKPLQAACEAFEKTLAMKGEEPVNWMRLAKARRLLAVAIGPKAKDSDATFQKAHDEISKAIGFNDGNAGFWKERGEVNFLWARTQELRRKNAGEAWKRCYADLTKALALGAKGDDLQKKIKLSEAGMAKHGVKK